MNKPMLGLVAGGLLGAVDGLSALVSAPEVAPEIAFIVAGVIIGWFARKVNNVTAGLIFGLAMGALFALPFALAPDATTHKRYFWEILIPGSMVGLIVGFLTQRYGLRRAERQTA